MRRHHLSTLLACLLAAVPAGAAEEEDPFAWLEDVSGERALAWVQEHNARSTKLLEARPQFAPIQARTLEILDSKDKIPTPLLLGTTVYNFWKDEAHPRGIWRRTSLASYRKTQPSWETVLDLDALSKAEKAPWVFQEPATTCLPPAYRRCLVSLSRGGADAAVVREFDTRTKAFVPGGFTLPEAKSSVQWRTEDEIWVGTDFGEGSLTTSGYARLVKLWKRGTPLRQARTVFSCGSEDVGCFGFSQDTPEGRYDLVLRVPAFYRGERFLLLGGRLVKLPLPEDAELRQFFRDQALISLRSDWTRGEDRYPAGALVAFPLDGLLAGSGHGTLLFEPVERASLNDVRATRDRVLVQTLDNVHGKLASWSFSDGAWHRSDVELPGLGTVEVEAGAASETADAYFFSYTDFLSPSSLWLVQGASPPEKVKALPAFFDAAGMEVSQHQATSKDGTAIPYFLVTPKGFVADGSAPTLLYGYGGFEVAEVPTYSGTLGSAWLARGGAYALANIRGGGEFGPRWHEAALKETRIKSFQDFLAVADDLVARKVTSTPHLGIMGGSQGGLLVGAAFTLRPELFGAVVAQVPLADMRRYSKLLAGASWMAEYGDPDVPEQWAYIRTWSPYHLLRKDVRYPTPFYWTNTRDDRVHPGHARKMVARMESLGDPVLYFENVAGGHGSGSVNKETAYVTALQYAYLWQMLGR